MYLLVDKLYVSEVSFTHEKGIVIIKKVDGMESLGIFRLYVGMCIFDVNP
jgi:glutathione synthase/RimK-type ligase-like ATP-grasp enzyme